MNGSNIWINLNADDKVTPKLQKVKNATNDVVDALSTVMTQAVNMGSAFATSATVSKEQIGAVQLATDVLTDKFTELKDVVSGLEFTPKFIKQLSDSVEKAEKLTKNLNRVKNYDDRAYQIYKTGESGVDATGKVGKSAELSINQAKYNAELAKTLSTTDKIIDNHRAMATGLDKIVEKHKSQLNTAKMVVNQQIAKNNGNNKEIAQLTKTLRLVNENKKKREKIIAICGRSNDEVGKQNNKLREQVRILNQRNNTAQRFKPSTPKVMGAPQAVGSGGGFGGKLMGAIGSLAGAVASIASVGALVRISDELTNIKARIAMVNDEYNKVNQTKITSAALEKKIMEAANRSRASYFDTAEIVARIGMNAGGAFKSGDEVVAFAELMQKSFVVAGSKAEEMRSAMLQLSQGMASNRLQGDELRAIFESAPVFTKYIADYLNVSQGEVRELASEGKLSAEVIKNAFFNAGAEIEAKFAKMPYTFTQLWTVFKNKAFEAWEPLYERLRLFANGQTFQKFFTGLVRGVEIAAQVAIKIVDVIDGAIKQLRDSMWAIRPIFLGIAAAMSVMGVAALIAKAKTLALGTGAMWSSIQYQIALFKMSVAQHGLNATLAMCPITWFIYGIIAIVAAFYLAIAAVNKFAGKNISATGIIAAMFVWLGSTIANIFLYLGNLFLIFADFVRNFLRNPVYTIQKLFADLFLNILDFTISAIDGWDVFCTNIVHMFTDAINWVLKGWNKLADTTVGKKLGLEKKELIQKDFTVVSTLKGMRDNIAANMQAKMPADYKESTKLNYLETAKNTSSAYNTTRDKVSEITGGLDILKEFKNDDEMLKYMNQMGFKNKTDFADYLNKAQNEHMGVGGDAAPDYSKYLSNMDKNLAKTAESFDDTEFMRSLGSREATNKFTTQEIKLTMNNTNNISKDADSNTFIGLLVEEIKRALMTSAESAYRG